MEKYVHLLSYARTRIGDTFLCERVGRGTVPQPQYPFDPAIAMTDAKRSTLLKGYIASVALSLFYLIFFGRTEALAALIGGAVFTECFAAFMDKSKGD
jgi:hypothetical protein